ncbi:MAG: deoxynucleoside kinase [Acidobacteriota bacterium]|nr:deoxynucleoside kinase [Acidobacteriota bacterium]
MANFFEPSRYIAVEGPIRVGKSTLSSYLAEQLHGQLIQEPSANPFLPSFYKGEPGAAFQAQMSFLIQRYEQLLPLEQRNRQKIVITDFLFEKDKIFANLNLNDDELAVYNRYYKMLRAALPTPDLVIYLQAPVDVLRKRLRRKNDASERAISDEYMEEVLKAYEHFFFHYSASDLLVVNTAEIDFVERSQDLQVLLRRLSEPIKGTQYFLPLGSQPGSDG